MFLSFLEEISQKRLQRLCSYSTVDPELKIIIKEKL